MTGFDLHAVDLEAHPGFGVNAIAAIEIGIFHRVDPVGIGGEEPRIGSGRRYQARIFDRLKATGEGVRARHRIRGGGEPVQLSDPGDWNNDKQTRDR